MSLGGSIIVPDKINLGFLKKFKLFVIKRIKKGDKFVIICGGGKLARDYIKTAKELNKTSSIHYDWVGIKATHLNAELIHSMFEKYAFKAIYENYHKKIPFKHILIGSGFYPGTSTDYEAARFAALYKSGAVFNLTNTNYVYTKDPRKFRDARPLKNLTWKEYKKLIGGTWRPGKHLPFDPVASKSAQKNKLKVYILNGLNLNNFEKCLDGRKFRGTIIS